MKRNRDLVEAVLEQLEEEGPIDGYEDLEDLEGEHEKEEVIYHLKLLEDGEFVEANWRVVDPSEYDDPQSKILAMTVSDPDALNSARLTWKGHDLLDEMRDDTEPFMGFV